MFELGIIIAAGIDPVIDAIDTNDKVAADAGWSLIDEAIGRPRSFVSLCGSFTAGAGLWSRPGDYILTPHASLKRKL
jgi:hypothetical protein